MTAAHTRGPWHIDTWLGSLAGANGTDHDGNHHAVWTDGLLICTTGLVGTPESAENARLIAAAPQLAEALELLINATTDTLNAHDETGCCSVTRDAIDRARAALAAAGVSQ